MRVRFFNGGYCRQLLALADRRTWRIGEFQAVFLAAEHPRHGWVLIDTGYGTTFPTATQRWPRCLYRWVTPVSSPRATGKILEAHGLDPTAIRQIILTHFHADHVGGVREFPGAVFHYVTEALAPLSGLSAWSQTRHAFLPDMLPDNFAALSSPVSLTQFRRNEVTGLPGHDLFGDGSIMLLSLPGHAPGHLGVLLDDDAGPLLYAADAFWHHRQIDEPVAPLLPARIAIHDNRAYNESVAHLRRLKQQGRLRIVACHCPATQRLVQE